MGKMKDEVEEFCSKERRRWPGTEYLMIDKEKKSMNAEKTIEDKWIKDHETQSTPHTPPTEHSINIQNIRMFALTKAAEVFDYKTGAPGTARLIKDAKDFEQYILGE